MNRDEQIWKLNFTQTCLPYKAHVDGCRGVRVMALILLCPSPRGVLLGRPLFSPIYATSTSRGCVFGILSFGTLESNAYKLPGIVGHADIFCIIYCMHALYCTPITAITNHRSLYLVPCCTVLWLFVLFNPPRWSKTVSHGGGRVQSCR